MRCKHARLQYTKWGLRDYDVLLFVCSFVVVRLKRIHKTRFSKNEATYSSLMMMTTDRKSYMGHSRNSFLDPCDDWHWTVISRSNLRFRAFSKNTTCSNLHHYWQSTVQVWRSLHGNAVESEWRFKHYMVVACAESTVVAYQSLLQ